MAYGHEVVLGFAGEVESRRAAAEMGLVLDSRLRWDDEDSDDEEGDLSAEQVIANMAVAKDVDRRLLDAYRTILKSMGTLVPGFVHVGRTKGARSYEVVDTPLGRREMSPPCLSLYYEPGDGEPADDAVLGVGLSSRYFPRLMDWRSAHGSLDTIALDKAFFDLFHFTKDHIAAAVPAFASAVPIVKPVYY